MKDMRRKLKEIRGTLKDLSGNKKDRYKRKNIGKRKIKATQGKIKDVKPNSPKTCIFQHLSHDQVGNEVDCMLHVVCYNLQNTLIADCECTSQNTEIRSSTHEDQSTTDFCSIPPCKSTPPSLGMSGVYAILSTRHKVSSQTLGRYGCIPSMLRAAAHF